MVKSHSDSVGTSFPSEADMDRKRLIDEAVHSGEMEGAYVSAEFREDADEYVKGDISIEELMRRTKRRWNPERESVHHGA